MASRTPLPVPGGSFTGLSATDAWHRAEPVMQHIQHLSFERLVKMDHFLLVVAVPVYAHAQNLRVGDAQKVVTIISSDKGW
jgi:hypothetical protein